MSWLKKKLKKTSKIIWKVENKKCIFAPAFREQDLSKSSQIKRAKKIKKKIKKSLEKRKK